MAKPEKSGFTNAAMEDQTSEYQPQGPYYSQQYGVNPPPLPPHGGGGGGGHYYPPPYLTQPQYSNAQAPPPSTVVYNQYGAPSMIVTAQPVRETGPAPDTQWSLIVSIVSIVLCLGAWPFAVVAIIFNRKAKGQADLGQYTVARGTLRTCFIFVGVTLCLGTVAWVIFAIRLKTALDYVDHHEHRYYG